MMINDKDQYMGGSTVARLLNNRISFFGIFVALLMAFLILLNIGLNLLYGMKSPYGGMYVYVIFLPALVFGLILIPIGMYRSWRRFQKTGETPHRKWPYVDFNDRGNRIAAGIFINGTILFVIISAVVSYGAYHYSESVEFCGTLCHSVMEPEHTAYQGSPHARVSCTACHVGEGAGWYTKSKLSGAYQLYAVTANIYPRPIPTPIENLRPAQETCEKCHWPEKFFGAQQKQFDHYKYDEANTHWPINMLIKTGGGDPKIGRTSGIHWHMNIGVKVEYIARDEKQQDIPWVKITDRKTGRVTIYQDETDALTEEEIAAGTPRLMDCMDCHNRPSHIFKSPDFFMDRAILTGQIDQDIPYIKQVAVEALAVKYNTKDEALMGIANYIVEYYRREMPKTYERERVAIDKAIIVVQAEYSKNIFPEMMAQWSSYYDNIGHFENPGCIRCHLGNHKSDEGVTITHDCKACHIILSQGSSDDFEVSVSPEGLDFKHPEDISEIWRNVACHRCHKGVQP